MFNVELSFVDLVSFVFSLFVLTNSSSIQFQIAMPIFPLPMQAFALTVCIPSCDSSQLQYTKTGCTCSALPSYFLPYSPLTLQTPLQNGSTRVQTRQASREWLTTQ